MPSRYAALGGVILAVIANANTNQENKVSSTTGTGPCTVPYPPVSFQGQRVRHRASVHD